MSSHHDLGAIPQSQLAHNARHVRLDLHSCTCWLERGTASCGWRPGRIAAPPESSPGRVLSDQAVDGLADEVGVTGVPRVLLDEVDQHPAQTGRNAVLPGRAPGEVETAVGERLGEQLA